MQLEQFYDSSKLTSFEGLLKKYPYAYITASDYESSWFCEDLNGFISSDECLCSLKCLCNSKDFRSFLIDPDFFNFVGSDYNRSCAENQIENAENFIKEIEDDQPAEK
nr:hypothetical protein IMFVHALQ_IMFVHALQ_CDS_0003 [Microvirus sp.]